MRSILRPAHRRAAISLAAAAVLGVSTAAVATSANAAGTHTAGPAVGPAWSRACEAPAPGMAACEALLVNNVTEHVRALGVTPNATPAGYGPADLRSAYKLPAGGAGQTVAIVDAYNDPNAAADMAVYRSQFGLPACTVASGCFKQVDQTGGSTLPSGDTRWAGEISLDLDVVSAVAPNAHIILVEATSSALSNLGTAVNTAVRMGAKFVSNSYGSADTTYDSYYDTNYFNHPGVAITAASGDSGYHLLYPATSPYVTAVGGTSLRRNSGTARGWTESVWSSSSTLGAGSGCSAYEAKPAWQKDSGCGKRTVADVSAVADPATGIAVYQTYGASGWRVFGGTSVAAPLIAAVYADAGTPKAAIPAADIYSHTSALNDVTTGATATCTPSYLCQAGTGFDGPTGWGTPNGLTAFTG